MSPLTFVCETPMIRERPRASFTPPSPPSKRHCMRTADFLLSPCDSLCLPLLDHFDSVAEEENGPFLPILAPRFSSSLSSFHTLSIGEPDKERPFALKKRSAAIAFTPMSFQPCNAKQKLSVHALCA